MSTFEHPGSVPPRPEVPEGVVPAPLPPSAPPPGRAPEPEPDKVFAPWMPFAAMFMALLVALVGFALIAVFVEAAGTPVDGDDPPTGVTVGGTIIQDIALIGAAILLAGAGGRRPSAWTFGIRRTGFWRSVGWAAALMACFYVFSFAWALALGIDESDDLAEELGAKDSTLNMVVVAVLVAIIAPITEEFFFRGFTFTALAGWLGWVPGALATGVIFGLIHAGGTDVEFLVPLAAFGFLLCVLYRKTGSILPCIALHALNNAIALGVTLGWEPWQVALGAIAGPVLSTAAVLPLANRVPPRWTPAPA